MNPLQMIVQMKKTGQDPRQMIIRMLSANPNLDGIGQNLLKCAKDNDLDGATNITQNVAREKGINTSDVLNNFNIRR